MRRVARIVVVALALCALIIVSQSLFIVDQTRQVIILEFGRPVATITTPGIHVKVPFIQSMVTFEKRMMTSHPSPGEYLDAAKKRVVVDHVTRWRIADPLRFYQTVRDQMGGRGRLQPVVFSEMRDELALHAIAEMISVERETIMETVAQRVRPKVADFGMEIIDVRIRRIDLPDEVLSSVFARMEAERGRIASQYRAEGEERAALTRANADKERTIILAQAYQESQILRGEGDAEATRIYAEAFTRDREFYTFVRTLEAYQQFLPQGSTLVLSTESELFKYIVNPKPTE
jgi:membrane protease subunit HflC